MGWLQNIYCFCCCLNSFELTKVYGVCPYPLNSKNLFVFFLNRINEDFLVVKLEISDMYIRLCRCGLVTKHKKGCLLEISLKDFFLV